jgi:hypothetical protein
MTAPVSAAVFAGLERQGWSICDTDTGNAADAFAERDDGVWFEVWFEDDVAVMRIDGFLDGQLEVDAQSTAEHILGEVAFAVERYNAVDRETGAERTCEYTADGADPTPGNPACGAPASVCNPHGLSGKDERWFDYDEWYCERHADPAWLAKGGD